jgi:hypothetical protein
MASNGVAGGDFLAGLEADEAIRSTQTEDGVGLLGAGETDAAILTDAAQVVGTVAGIVHRFLGET